MRGPARDWRGAARLLPSPRQAVLRASPSAGAQHGLAVKGCAAASRPGGVRRAAPAPQCVRSQMVGHFRLALQGGEARARLTWNAARSLGCACGCCGWSRVMQIKPPLCLCARVQLRLGRGGKQRKEGEQLKLPRAARQRIKHVTPRPRPAPPPPATPQSAHRPTASHRHNSRALCRCPTAASTMQCLSSRASASTASQSLRRAAAVPQLSRCGPGSGDRVPRGAAPRSLNTGAHLLQARRAQQVPGGRARQRPLRRWPGRPGAPPLRHPALAPS
jgi:hypothetical protein